MFRSITDLKESGVKLKKAEKCQQLDVMIAPVSMDDYKFTLFRNMVPFEQCHFFCKPHVTAYIFFLDRLINSAEDMELLHYAGVMQHTLEAFSVPLSGVKPSKDLSMAVEGDIPLDRDQAMDVTTRVNNFIIWFMSLKEPELLMNISA
ncbi:UPF0481 protein-like protein [Tanacetum coccineum]